MSEPRPIYPKHFFREPVPRESTGFILMPFAPEFEPVHEAIRTGIESAGLSPQRADDIFSTRSGMEKILRGIAKAEVVVADMTERNANVFYEAGIAHMAKENVILLTQDKDDFPFDLQHIDHIVYEVTEDGLRVLTEKLADVIQSLDPEPSPEEWPTTPAGGQVASAAETRGRVLRLLQECERSWLQRVVPEQDRVFRDQFWPRLQEAKSDAKQQAILAESISALQPAFLRPWEPIEEIGFQVIDGGGKEYWPSLFQALEHAHALSTRNEVRGAHTTVVGHGQLLALRTWTLWGAYALRCENWEAVDILLHRQVSFQEIRWSSSSSFPANGHLYAPDAAGAVTGLGYYFPTAESLYDHTEIFAEKNFFNLEELQGYTGLWLFCVDLACLMETGHLPFPGWIFSPIEQLERILSKFARKEYATNFLQSVMHDHPASVNMRWHAIRESLTDHQRLGSTRFPQLRHLRIPERFDEHGS